MLPQLKHAIRPLAAASAVLLLSSGCGPGIDAPERLPTDNGRIIDGGGILEGGGRDPVDTPGVEIAENPIAPAQGGALDLRYDRRNVITVEGAVLGKEFVDLEGDVTGVIVEVQPGGDFIHVLIGTTKFLAYHGFDVGITHRILVTGSLIETDGRRLMLARELSWKGKKLVLRDETGWPRWRARADDED